ncbi:MAG: hypothetical protein JO202_13140 [Ktedonobacteraceae bacterium]|nr:hypothetical protein [Ktedonobacteraceae bacterium]
MTFVSVADACRCLGIDAKTLHHWLADAQLPLQGYPRDGRKKGVSQEQLQMLARLHHRHLASAFQESLPAIPADRLPLPPALLALPDALCTLQAQIAALQRQVADLTSLLQRQARQPESLLSPAWQPPPARRPPTLTSPAPRAHSTATTSAKAPPKPAHVIPRVEYDQQGHYVVICPKRGVLPFEPDTSEWFAWVAEQSSFRFVGKQGHFSAHHEWLIPHGAWRAHRQIRNHSYNLRLAPNQELTIAVLEQAAAALQAHLA